MRLLLSLISLTCLLVYSTAHSQSPPQQTSPEEAQQRRIDSTLNAMGPMMGRMAESMIQVQLKIAAQPETASAVAAFKKNLFDALQKRGFTAEQALQIVVATGLPAANMSGR